MKDTVHLSAVWQEMYAEDGRGSESGVFETEMTDQNTEVLAVAWLVYGQW